MKPTAGRGRKSRWFRFAPWMGVLCLHGLLVGRGLALDPAQDLKQYNCRVWNRQNGLPATSINAIAQTKDGYLWFGTASGLLRFDGTEFKALDLHSVAELRTSYVTSLSSAGSGGLWVGLEHSAFGFYDGQTFSFRGSKVVSLDVQSLLESRNGTLWLAAYQQAVRLNPSGELETILPSAAFTNTTANAKCVYEDREGRVWFGTLTQGAFYWQDGKITQLSAPELGGNKVTCITEDLAGQIWIGTGNGLFCYDASNLKRREIPPLTPEVRVLLVDRHGVLWIGTSWNGLVRYQNGRYDYFLKTDGLDNETVQALYEDREGCLWIGTGGGLDQLSDVKFPIQPATDDPKITDANSVAAARNGGVWIASYGGVVRFDPQTKSYTHEPGLPATFTKRVFEARNGDLYFVCGTTNLVVSSGGKFVATNGAPDLVVAMAEDDQGVVVSVAGNLYRAGTNYFRPYTFKTNVPPDFYWISNLASGRDGVIWVACGNGIFRIKDGLWQHWAEPEGLVDANVQTVTEDQDGVLWAGMFSGIARLKDNQIRLISRKDGLFDNNIYGIEPDDMGNLWVDSSRGISRVARYDLNALADGQTNHMACTVFDGLDSVKTTDKTAQERVGCQTADGRIWFPGPLGVVMIDPAHLLTNPVAPPVHIERVLADGREVARNADIVVPPGRGELEFHFHALSFSSPAKVQIRYRLEGYDQDWVDAGARRLAFYTNLKPGSYTFRVIAASADGVWNNVGDSIAIELRPYFYQTGWFFYACCGLLLAALVGGYRVRIRTRTRKERQAQAVRAELEKRVEARTNELAESLSVLNATLGSTADGILVVNSQRKKIFQNQQIAEMWNLPPAIVQGADDDAQVRHIMNVVANPEQFLETVQNYYAHPHLSGQTEVELKDGKILERNTAPVLGTDGRYFGRIWTFRDVTQKRRAEAALRESQALYHSLVEQLPCGVFRKDAAGRFVYVNAAFARNIGMPTEQILGRNAVEVVSAIPAIPGMERPPDQMLGTQGIQHHERIMQTGQQIIVEDMYPGLDDRRNYYHTVKSPVFDSAGKIVGSQGVLFDVTDRKQAELALAYERDLLRELLENSPDHIYFKDRQSRFIESSNAQARQFGVDNSDELVGKSDFDFFSEDHARPAFEDEQKIIRTGLPMIGKIERESYKDGRRESWVLTTKMPLRNKAGEIIGTFGISKDITAIVETEAKLKETHQRLLETSRLAGMAEVATNVLHNVGNVLNSVNVSAALVVDNTKQSKIPYLGKVVALLNEHAADLGGFITNDPKGRQLPGYLGQLAEQLAREQQISIQELELLRQNIEHIKEIVAMQQSYAKISGVTETIAVSDLVEDAVRMNLGALARHEVELIREYGEVPPITVEKHKVLQILVNLIRNAKYACDDSRRNDKQLRLQVARTDHGVRIAVIDNGIGILPENMTRIFSHGFTTRKLGHGFGLHSGALTAKELGGSLKVHSDGAGQGAAFTLNLPVSPPKTEV